MAFEKFCVEKKKNKGDSLGLIFDKEGFIIKIEENGIFSSDNKFKIGDRLLAISSDKRMYYANLFCMSLNNQKWANFVSGIIKIVCERNILKRKIEVYDINESERKKIRI